MHARQLLAVASSLAEVGQVLNRSHIHTAGDAAHAYWLANRFRCDAWHQRISQHRTAIERCGTSRRRRLWDEILPTLEEILISEPLSRVTAYLSALLEIRLADGDWSALAHSVLASHIEARLRCLNLMVFGYGFPVEQAVRLNRLRRLMETTNDSLIGSLPSLPQLDGYGFDLPLIYRQQSGLSRSWESEGIDRIRLQCFVASALRSISMDHGKQSANPRLNANIAESAMGLLPPELFDSFGLIHSRRYWLAIQPGNDITSATNDLDRPLAEPFNFFIHHRPHSIENLRRRL